MHIRIRVITTTIAAGVLLASVISAQAEEAAPQPPIGSSLALSKFYAGPLGNRGEFRGKLLCLCCDLMPASVANKKCDAKGHQAVLLVESESMLHPLLAGTEDVNKQLSGDDLHGKEVIVSGSYYPSTGLIFASSVRVAK